MTSRNAAKPPCFSSQPGSAHWVCSASAGGGKRTQSPEHITKGNIGGPPQGGLFAALHFGRDWPEAPLSALQPKSAFGVIATVAGVALRLLIEGESRYAAWSGGALIGLRLSSHTRPSEGHQGGAFLSPVGLRLQGCYARQIWAKPTSSFYKLGQLITHSITSPAPIPALRKDGVADAGPLRERFIRHLRA
jgi:hypothetical protein